MAKKRFILLRIICLHISICPTQRSERYQKRAHPREGKGENGPSKRIFRLPINPNMVKKGLGFHRKKEDAAVAKIEFQIRDVLEISGLGKILL